MIELISKRERILLLQLQGMLLLACSLHGLPPSPPVGEDASQGWCSSFLHLCSVHPPQTYTKHPPSQIYQFSLLAARLACQYGRTIFEVSGHNLESSQT